MAAPVPVYVSTNYAAGPNQPIPVYVVNSDGGGSDSYTKTESDDKYATKTAFYNYAGGDDTHPPEAASATYTPASAFYAYTGGNAGEPPASASSTYLKSTVASSTYATLVQTQGLANDLLNEIANSEDLANKTQTITGSTTQYPSCAAVSTALSGKVDKNAGTASALTVTSGMKVTTYGTNMNEGIIFTPTSLTNGVSTIRFNDTNGVYKSSIAQRTDGSIRVSGCHGIDAAGYSAATMACLSLMPGSTAAVYALKIHNAGGFGIGGIKQENDAVTLEAAAATFSGDVSLRNGTMKKVLIDYADSAMESALTIKGFGFNKGWACTMTPSAAIETDGTEYYRFMDQAGTTTRGVMIFRKQTTPAINVVVYKGGLESQTNTNWVNDIVTAISSPTHRQLATALATKTYIDTADATKINTSAIATTIDGTVTNSQVPGALAMKNYVDSKVVSTSALSFTVPAEINVGTLLYYSSIPASVFEMVYAFRFDFSDYLLTDRFQMITLISSITEWVNLSMEVEYISANRTANALAPGRRMYYFSKGAGETTATVVTDTNAYYTENTTLPYVTIESNSSVANYNHFKLWAHNGSANKGFISMKVTFHFTRINVA